MVQPAARVAPPGTPMKKGRASRVNWGPYLLLLPSMVLLAVFTLYPMIASGYLALFQANIAHKVPVFNGLGNFADLFSSEIFRKVLKNTVIYAVGTVPLTVLLSLFLAVQLNRKLKSVAFFRATFFYPTMLPLVSAASLWNFMYNPLYGPVNGFLKLFGISGPNWLGTPQWALPAVMFVAVWKDAGYFMIFYLAGLQNMPGDVYEAADLDGASPWQQFWKITFPLLMPTTLFVATISFINAFKAVDQIFVMTGGGPENATNLLLYYIWEQTFSNLDKGMGAAASVVLIAILLAAALFNHFYVDKRVHYE
jgi:sn-glycerol 3-phosphate transport system permease protein